MAHINTLRKRLILLVAFFCFIQPGFTQNKFEVEFSETYYPTEGQICLDQDQLVVTSRTKKGFNLNWFKGKDTISLEIITGGLIKSNNKKYSFITAVLDDEFFLYHKKMFFHFTRNENSLKLLKKINLRSYVDQIKVTNDKVVLINYNMLSKDFSSSKVWEYDFFTKNLNENSFKLDAPMAKSIGPSTYIDYLFENSDKKVVSRITKYEINIYENNALVDSIILKNSDVFKSISKEDMVGYKRVQRNHQSLRDIQIYNTKMRKMYSHIWSVFYLEENCILVRCSHPAENGFELEDHLWQKNKEKWELVIVKKVNPYEKESFHDEITIWPYYAYNNNLMKNRNELSLLHYVTDLKPLRLDWNTYFLRQLDFRNNKITKWDFRLN